MDMVLRIKIRYPQEIALPFLVLKNALSHSSQFPYSQVSLYDNNLFLLYIALPINPTKSKTELPA